MRPKIYANTELPMPDPKALSFIFFQAFNFLPQMEVKGGM
jgi:hypothetical protein